MKIFNKKCLLEQLTEKLEAQLKEVTEIYQHEHSTVLLKQAKGGGWSVAQCLEHLNSYSVHYHKYIRKALLNQSPGLVPDIYRSTWAGDRFIKMMTPATNGKRYKASKIHIPAAKLNAHSVVAMFVLHQRELIKYMEKAHHADLDAIRIPTSVIAWVKLKLGDVLQFLVVHNERHLLQAKRNYLSQAIITE